MIEILNIFFLIFSIVWICSFPILQNNLFKAHIFNELSNLEKISINLSIFLNILLILSFYKISLNHIFIFLLILPIINFINIKFKFDLTNILILISLTFVLSVYVGSNLKLEWDAQALWIYRTINFLNGNDFTNLSNIPGVLTYPHLGTFSWAFFWKNSFIDHEYTGRIFYIFSYCLSLMLIISHKKIEILPKLIMLFTFVIFSLDFYLLAGYQEYLIFSYLIFIFYFYKMFFNQKKIIYLLPVFCFINAIIWIKNEATVFTIFFIIYILSHHFLLKRKLSKEISFLIITFLVLIFLKYLIFYYFFGEVSTGWQDYNINTIFNLLKISYFIDRAPFIFTHIIIALVKCKIYILFFLLLLFYYSKKNSKIFISYLIFFLLNIFLIFLIYYMTDSPDWKTYITTTSDRLLFQTSGVYLILIYDILLKNLTNKNDLIN